MIRSAAVCVFVLLAGCDRCMSCGDDIDAVSDIKPDETVVFFRTAGWFDDARDEWHLPVHGWIYEPQDSRVRLTAFERILSRKYDLSVTDATAANFARRVNLVIADNERDKRIVVDIAGRIHELPASAPNGHFESTIVIPADDAARHAKNGRIHFSAVTGDAESRTFDGAVGLLEPEGFSVISDIDDTVKVSNVGDRRSLLEHTFLLDFVSAPGMAERYRDWSGSSTGFHFVSSSPWQLYEPLSEFLDTSGFPWATFSLKAVRFRDETFFDLFKKGTETKPAQVSSILDRYPEREFVLVGDSGEQDPEVYAELMRSRPDQVLKIFIRNVTGDSPGGERFSSVFANIDPERWELFDNPDTLVLPGSP